MGCRAFIEGRLARIFGRARRNNPYRRHARTRDNEAAWDAGWDTTDAAIRPVPADRLQHTL